MKITTDVYVVTYFNGSRNETPSVYDDMHEAIADYKIKCALEIIDKFGEDPVIDELKWKGSSDKSREEVLNDKVQAANNIIDYATEKYTQISYTLHMFRVAGTKEIVIQLFGVR